jgi:hypothetical protein
LIEKSRSSRKNSEKHRKIDEMCTRRKEGKQLKEKRRRAWN